MDIASLNDGILDEPMEVIGRAIWNSSQTDASNTSAIFLGSDRHQRLARNTPSFLSRRHAADLGFVHLDSTAEPVPTGPHYGLIVPDLAGCPIRGEPHFAQKIKPESR